MSVHYKMVGLVVAIVIAFIGMFRFKRKLSIAVTTVAFFNGLLIYVTASGIDSIQQGSGKGGIATQVNSTSPDSSKTQPTTSALLSFTNRTPWWPSVVLTDSIEYYKETTSSLEVRHRLLVRENEALRDTIDVLNVQQAIPSDQPNSSLESQLANCLTSNEKFRLMVEKLTNDVRNRDEQQPAPTPVSINNDDLLRILSEMRDANKTLLSSVNRYTKAGAMDPKTQRQALIIATESIADLQRDLINYNTQLDKLREKLKGN
jgi:hypothetical protein